MATATEKPAERHCWTYVLACGCKRVSLRQGAEWISTRCGIHGESEVAEEIAPTATVDYTDEQYREFGKFLFGCYGFGLMPDGTSDVPHKLFNEGLGALEDACGLDLPENTKHPVIRAIAKSYREEARAHRIPVWEA